MKEFTPNRPNFYCLKVTDIQTNREERISQLFGEDYNIWYLGPNDYKVEEISIARFWKCKKSAEFAGLRVKKKAKDVICEVLTFNREEFINLIPDNIEGRTKHPSPKGGLGYIFTSTGGRALDDYVIRRNLKLKRSEIDYLKREKELLSKYKCIDSYKFPDIVRWNEWLKCPNCNLRPLVREFNNGSSTACGCGKNQYDHFSIHSESIMSYVSRNKGSALEYPRFGLRDNWNHWVKTGEILFDSKSEKNSGKW